MIAAFSVSVYAVDVKISGEYYAAGMYLDKTTLVKDSGPSTAFYFQRLRVMTDIVASPGLSVTARADIMERAWGANRSTPATTLDTNSEGTKAENENIAFDLLYVTYVSPIGIFTAGYQPDASWGTVFGNSDVHAGKVTYTYIKGGLAIGLQTGKVNGGELSYTAKNSATASDRDLTIYTAFVNYTFKDGSTGFLAKYYRNATTRAALGSDNGYMGNRYLLIPYFKAKFGPVFIQGEIDSVFGQMKKYEGTTAGANEDAKLEQYAAFLDATADFGKGYIGATFAYVGGDDPATTKYEGGIYTGGTDWNPCLIMFNSDLSYWVGSLAGYNSTASGGPMTNAYFLQGRAGVRLIDKLDIMASFSWAKADKTPQATWESRNYGYEVDLTATYKITNNLSYMLGAGYWFVGDYYYGTTSSNRDLTNNYMLINKLTLTF